MTELSERKIKGLIRLINKNRIEPEDIKDEEYKAEVESKLDDEE